MCEAKDSKIGDILVLAVATLLKVVDLIFKTNCDVGRGTCVRAHWGKLHWVHMYTNPEIRQYSIHRYIGTYASVPSSAFPFLKTSLFSQSAAAITQRVQKSGKIEARPRLAEDGKAIGRTDGRTNTVKDGI